MTDQPLPPVNPCPHCEFEVLRAAVRMKELNAKIQNQAETIKILTEALEGMWSQFAYRTDTGKLYTGGLSALEDCQQALDRVRGRGTNIWECECDPVCAKCHAEIFMKKKHGRVRGK